MGKREDGRMERGVIFNGDMMRAIISGRKTQTRRPIRPQPEMVDFGSYVGAMYESSKSPFGVAGDLIYPRETTAIICMTGDCECHCEDDADHVVEYRADTGNRHPGEWPEGEEGAPKWTPSILMPRDRGRTLRLVVRSWVERLQDITEADAMAEGVSILECIGPSQTLADGSGRTQWTHPYTISFASTWDSIYAGRGLGWSANPWVWCCEFGLEDVS